MITIENTSDIINKEILSDEGHCSLVKMKGNSMAADGIRDGDILLVDKAFTEVDDKIVLAWLEGSLMVRRLQKTGARIRLLSGGNYFSPLEVDPYSNFKILGVIRFVVRAV